MSIFIILQIIIALVFIFLILSQLTSGIQEAIAAQQEFRAKRLKQSIRQILGEESLGTENTSQKSSLTASLYQNPIISSLNQRNTSIAGYWVIGIISLLIGVVGLLIKVNLLVIIGAFIISLFFFVLAWFKKKPGWNKSRSSVGPSYIEPPELFGKALIEVIQEKLTDKLTSKNNEIDAVITKLGTLDPNLSDAKLRLIQIANTVKLQSDNPKLSDFQSYLTELFTASQQRTSGVYKRNAQGISFLLGLVVAVIANADTFNIVNTLSKTSSNIGSKIGDEFARNQTINKCFEKTGTEREECVNNLDSELNNILGTLEPLPLGWDFDDNTQPQRPDIAGTIKKQGGWFRVLFGWIVSAIAIMMGAPFWFEMLGRIINVRNAGKPPESPKP